jgi:hypothetical protein
MASTSSWLLDKTGHYNFGATGRDEKLDKVTPLPIVKITVKNS